MPSGVNLFPIYPTYPTLPHFTLPKNTIQSGVKNIQITIIIIHYMYYGVIRKFSEKLLSDIRDGAIDILKHYCSRGQIVGNKISSCCPFHAEKTASFSFDVAGIHTGRWRCFGCGKAGRDIFSFVAQVEGLTAKEQYPDVVKKCCEILNIDSSAPEYTLKEWVTPPGLLDDTEGNKREARNDSGAEGITAPEDAKQAPQRPIKYLPEEWVAEDEKRAEETILFKFLCSIFAPENVRSAFAMYHSGGRERNGAMWNSFPLINAEGFCVDSHLMPYNEDGHRRKDKYSQDWALRIRGEKDYRAPWPLFGEHLLAKHPEAPVAVVESEKTAIIGAMVAPEFIWVAVLSVANLAPGRLEAARNRDIYLFPDVDGVELWRSGAEGLAAEGFRIYFADEIVTSHSEGNKEDIADLILRFMRGEDTLSTAPATPPASPFVAPEEAPEEVPDYSTPPGWVDPENNFPDDDEL